MSFLSPPKPPKPVPPANPPTTPIFTKPDLGPNPLLQPSSLISTSSSGLKRKASTQKISLIGG